MNGFHSGILSQMPRSHCRCKDAKPMPNVSIRFLCQRLLQIRNQIIHIFNTNRQT